MDLALLHFQISCGEAEDKTKICPGQDQSVKLHGDFYLKVHLHVFRLVLEVPADEAGLGPKLVV